ncbi:hypothetical protein BD289DRAFT_200946 [Coniella lustricola]|uniref:Uncharacterized protein n=1 Tax=Coniella lustricola TaxID=2025994 RepID=A0A2T3ACI8_9PEZI|nr:hypothetical protein BD289DRAFT_200946 [Coniella lustricola]
MEDTGGSRREARRSDALGCFSRVSHLPRLLSKKPIIIFFFPSLTQWHVHLAAWTETNMILPRSSSAWRLREHSDLWQVPLDVGHSISNKPSWKSSRISSSMTSCCKLVWQVHQPDLRGWNAVRLLRIFHCALFHQEYHLYVLQTCHRKTSLTQKPL